MYVQSKRCNSEFISFLSHPFPSIKQYLHRVYVCAAVKVL